MGDISGHSPTATEAAVLEGTPCDPLPAMAATPTTLWPMDAPITTHATMPTGIVTPHPILTTSADVTHATQQTGAGLAPATPTALHRSLSPEKTNSAQDPESP